jgi:nucleotide-binding universal stress UspA family protein
MRGTSVRVMHAEQPFLAPWPAFAGPAGTEVDAPIRVGEQTLAIGLDRARRLAPDVAVDSLMVTEDAAAALVGKSGESAMVVVGSRGLGGFSELLMGSTGLEVASRSTCPVVVIRTGQVEPGPEAGRVVVGVDGSALSTEALGFAFEEASLRGCGLTAVHAWKSPYFDARGRGGQAPILIADEVFQGEELQVLRDALALWQQKAPDVDLRQYVVHSHPARALIAASAGAELVVVGSRGRRSFRSILLGSVSHAVLHHAHCPVAVVRNTDA